MYNKLVSKKKIDVEIRDIGNNIVDRTLFDSNELNNILNNGLEIRGIQLIQHSLIHYSTKFRKSKWKRFNNAYLDIADNIEISTNGKFILNSDEGSEFQSKSTEVIAVGLSIFLTTKLFKINRNQINSIEASGKRCDFRFVKSNLEYLIESKGRKGSISDAIDDTFLKKNSSTTNSAKYGIISQLPRNGNPAKIVIIDPPYEPKKITRKVMIENLLYYYSNLTKLAGFWRLSNLLYNRYEEIKSSSFLETFENKSIELGNVYKLGEEIEIDLEDKKYKYFKSRGNNNLNLHINNKKVHFLIDDNLIEILVSQKFNELIEYQSESKVLSYENRLISVENDGSVLLVEL